MAEGFGLRVLLFEADGTLRRLAGRVVEGLNQGEDCLPQYAGQRPRIAYAFLRVAGRKPRTLARVDGAWWEFDARGQIDDSKLEALRDALNATAAGAATPPGTQHRGDADLRPALAQRRLARRWHWIPTPADITRIVHAIWPEQAGRTVSSPAFASGQQTRRHPVSRTAKHARQRCSKHVYDLSQVIEALTEHDLKGSNLRPRQRC